MATEHLPLDAMVIGGVYRADFRSCFGVGIWDGRGFWAMRMKWHDVFAFREYHWDDGAPFGTTRPYELLETIEDFQKQIEVLPKPPDWPEGYDWNSTRAFVDGMLPQLNEKYPSGR